MTTRLDLPDDLVQDIRLRAAEEGRDLDETVADLLRIGLAAATRPATVIHADASSLKERKRIADKFISGEWGLELEGFEEGRAADRAVAEARTHGWKR